MSAMSLDHQSKLVFEMNEDYKLLKAINKLTGKPIRLKDLEQMKYKMFPDRGFMVLAHERLGINKMIYTQRLQFEFSVRPDALRLFLYNNGAEQVDPAGKPVWKRKSDSTHKESVEHGWRVPKTKFVWMKNSLGFWKKVLAEQLTLDELSRCAAAT